MSQKRILTNVTQLVSRVPKHGPIPMESRKNFAKFLNNYDNIVVMTGAGVSTESGLPDYRSEEVGLFNRSSYKPITYNSFMKNKDARTRYWARNFVGWPLFSSVFPNKTHMAIANLQMIPGKIKGVVTQNVDGLHAKAGSKGVIELHGNAFWVSCVNCNSKINRFDFQTMLQNLNPHMITSGEELRPDGDIEIDENDVRNFSVPDCEHCGGILKPTVVFFGENVPQNRNKIIEDMVEESEAMLVLGTTLSTLSSYRFVLQAYDSCKFICLVNIGPTRGDKLADLLINCNCSDLFETTKNY